jgi:hypothetical protein
MGEVIAGAVLRDKVASPTGIALLDLRQNRHKCAGCCRSQRQDDTVSHGNE